MANTDCYQLFRDRGATLTEDGSAAFLTPQQEILAASQQTIVAALTHLSLIRAQGDDVTEFLQGQLGNDVKALMPGQSQLTSYCTPKGRMLAIILLIRTDDGYLLLLPRDLRETLLPRLRMYVLRAKATLEADNETCLTGIAGPGAIELIQQHDLVAPTQDNHFETCDGTSILKIQGPEPRFLCLSSPAGTRTLLNQLNDKAVLAGRSAWEWLDIQAGLPLVYPATQEAFVPQMANLDLLDGINFKKGCYPGQEIVARMRYLGKLKQRMYRGHINAGACPTIGDAVYSTSFGEQSAGKIVLAQPAPTSGSDVLLVAQIRSAEAGDLHLLSLSGPPITLHPLPYRIEEG